MHLLIFLLPILFLLFYVSYFVVWVPLKVQAHFRAQGVRGPGYRLIVGNTSEIRRLHAGVEKGTAPRFGQDVTRWLLPYYTEWSRAYGKTFLFWFGWTPRLAISDPEMIKELFLNTGGGSIDTRKINPSAILLFGRGLVGLQGDKWILHRRITSPAFHMERIKEWVPEVAAITMKMLEKWEVSRDGRDSFEMEVNAEFQALSADIISRTAFGSSYEEGKRIFELQKRHMHLVTEALRSVYIPGFRFLPTNKNREGWKLDAETRELIRKLIRANGKPGENRRNLLTSLMTPHKGPGGVEGQELSEEEIIDECQTFYFAGRETTANLLNWAIVCLAMHQDWQQAAREEAVCILPDGEHPSGNILSDLKIISLVINETLRLYPPAVMVSRKATKNLKLGELKIPANTEFYFPAAAVHRDPDVWGADANDFNPARFNLPRKHLAAYFPFGLGPRTCVGQNLAIVEAKIVLTMILKHYSFVISSTYVHSPVLFMTLTPYYGVQIILSRVHE